MKRYSVKRYGVKKYGVKKCSIKRRSSKRRGMEGKMKTGTLSLAGSLTVEATLVMAVTLFLIASLLRGAFEIHNQAVGNMVLQEALEKADRREKGTTDIKGIEAQAGERLRHYFRCQEGTIALNDAGRRLEGRTGGGLSGDISIKKFNPEKFLRTVRAFS